jgi:hypothetical protein
MRFSLKSAGAAALLGACTLPGVAYAQTTPQEPGQGGIPIVLMGLGTFGRPLQLAAGADVLFLIGPTKNEDGVLGSQGIVAGANLGIGGWQVSAGAFKAGLPAVFSARLVYTETFERARVSDPNAAYLGASLGMTVLYIARVNLGVDYRIRGTGDRKALFVWSVGAHFYLWDSIKRRP